MKYLWTILISLFQPKEVDPNKKAMLNVIKYIEDNPHMWNQRAYPNGRYEPTCFGGLLLRELGLGNSRHLRDLPGDLYKYLIEHDAFSVDTGLGNLKKIVNSYKP